MYWARRLSSCAGLLLSGYLLGSHSVAGLPVLRAEPQSDTLSSAIRDRLRETDRALAETMQMLQEEKRYVPAIQGLNAFAISVGGIDAIADLESGQGVDPETFAGLYAGQAMAEVAEHISRDGEGHLTYKGKIVRMYNAKRTGQLFALRAELTPSPQSAKGLGSKKGAESPATKPKDE